MRKFLIRSLLIVLTPLLLMAHIGYGIYLGVIAAYEEFGIGWRNPLSTRFSKSTWDQQHRLTSHVDVLLYTSKHTQEHNMRQTREYTRKLLEAVEEGILDKDQVLLACLNYMSERDVQRMCEANLFFEHEEEEEEDESGEDVDNFNWVGSRHHY